MNTHQMGVEFSQWRRTITILPSFKLEVTSKVSQSTIKWRFCPNFPSFWLENDSKVSLQPHICHSYSLKSISNGFGFTLSVTVADCHCKQCHCKRLALYRQAAPLRGQGFPNTYCEPYSALGCLNCGTHTLQLKGAKRPNLLHFKAASRPRPPVAEKCNFQRETSITGHRFPHANRPFFYGTLILALRHPCNFSEYQPCISDQMLPRPGIEPTTLATKVLATQR